VNKFFYLKNMSTSSSRAIVVSIKAFSLLLLNLFIPFGLILRKGDFYNQRESQFTIGLQTMWKICYQPKISY
jgi:hypothetical protein